MAASNGKRAGPGAVPFPRRVVLKSVCRVLRDVIPPTPPGPEGSNGNGLVRVQ